MPAVDPNGALTGLSRDDLDTVIDNNVVTAVKLIYGSGDFVIFACKGGFTVKGTTTDEIVADASYKVSGKVTLYGGKPQLSATSIERIRDEESDKAVIAAFLASNLKGIGKVTSTSLAEKYGKKVLDVLLETPKKAASAISGLSVGRALLCSQAIDADEKHLRLLMDLRLLGLTEEQSERAYDTFGFTAAEEIGKNPYVLLRIPGVGFGTCEKIAVRSSVDPLDELRLAGAVRYTLEQLHANSGSSCFEPGYVRRSCDDIIRSGAAEGLEISETLLDSAYDLAVENSVKNGDAVVFRFTGDKCEGCSVYDEGAMMALKPFFTAEASIKREIDSFLSAPFVEVNRDKAKEAIDKIAEASGIVPDRAQTEALLMSLSRPVSIITGGPGTGKTTIVGILAKYFESKEIKCEFCAPTGRSAKRLSDAAGVKAYTIHRLLEMTADESTGEVYCNRNRENPLNARVVVVDEASMVDIMMFKSLLYAVKKDASLILIGDPDQLPSVGPGNVLADLLSCKAIPRVELSYVFRTQDECSIASNAYRILKGEPLKGNDGDFVIISCPNDDLASEEVRRQFEACGGGVEDTAILCPTKQNTLGTLRLNRELQELVTGGQELQFKLREDCVLRIGDKVMQMHNNYKLEYYDSSAMETQSGVYNGEIGEVEDIDNADKTVTILYDDGKRVVYNKEALEDIDLAYAVTVHKSQGCEFDTVIIALGKMNYRLSSRKLLYTAVTRGKRKVVIIDSAGRLNKMISSPVETVRHTALAGFLSIVDKRHSEV